MNKIPIHQLSNNVEVLSKLINSVAKKYQCHAKFDPTERKIAFSGDEAHKARIIKETMGFFNWDL